MTQFYEDTGARYIPREYAGTFDESKVKRDKGKFAKSGGSKSSGPQSIKLGEEFKHHDWGTFRIEGSGKDPETGEGFVRVKNLSGGKFNISLSEWKKNKRQIRRTTEDD